MRGCLVATSGWGWALLCPGPRVRIQFGEIKLQSPANTATDGRIAGAVQDHAHNPGRVCATIDFAQDTGEASLRAAGEG